MVFLKSLSLIFYTNLENTEKSVNLTLTIELSTEVFIADVIIQIFSKNFI